MPRASGAKELSPTDRANIIGAWRCGVKPAVIARTLQFNDSTVRSTIKRFGTKVVYSLDARKGRPPTVNVRIKRIIVRAARKQPKLSWVGLRFETGTKYCA